MIDIEDVIKEVLIRTGVDKVSVEKVCKHVFEYTVDMMKDNSNVQDILFNKLFKFKLKRRYKEDKSKKYTAR